MKVFAPAPEKKAFRKNKTCSIDAREKTLGTINEGGPSGQETPKRNSDVEKYPKQESASQEYPEQESVAQESPLGDKKQSSD
jgi:hypothetical protein